MYPPLVLFATYGLVYLKDYAIRNTKYGWHKAITFGYGLILTGSLLFMLGWGYRMVGSFLTTQTATKQQVLEIAAQLPPDATLLTLGPTLIFTHYTSIKTVEIYSTPQEALPEWIAASSSFYVLLNLSNIESQWKGLTPDLNFQWLKTHTELHISGEFPPYTLYEVQPLSP